MADQDERNYYFGNYRLDPVEKVVRLNGEMIHLPSKVMDVLIVLASRSGSIVSKADLMQAVWPDSFVEESNLTQSIYFLRKTLGKNASGTQIIETVPKRGYRFTPDVEVKESGRLAVVAEQPALARRSYLTPILIVFGIILVGFVAMIVAARFWSSSSAPVERVTFRRQTFSGNVTHPVISPDGKSLAFVRESAIYLQDVATGSNVKLDIPGHSRFGNLQFSSGGEIIYFRNESSTDAAGDTYSVSRFGGPVKFVAEKVWSTVSFSPDTRQMAFVRFYPVDGEWALVVKDLNDGHETNVYSCKLPNSIYRSGYPAWSPDGTQIAIVLQTQEQGNASKLVLVDLTSRSDTVVPTPKFVQLEQVVWMPEKNQFILTARENSRFFQLWNLNVSSGEVRPITNDLNIYRNPSLSSDGKTLLARQFSTYSHIWTSPAENLAQLRQITFGNLNRDGTVGINWTLDGKIIYSSRITGDVDIWSVEPGSGVRRQITQNAGTNNENPVPSGDGQLLFFESTRSGRRNIWRAAADGSKPTQVTFSEKEVNMFPTLSPDGRMLYFVQRFASSGSIYSRDLTTGAVEKLTEPGRFTPGAFLALSPDGRFLAFQNVNDEKVGNISEIGIIDVIERSEPRLVRILSPNPTIVWGPDGRTFDYAENHSTGSRLWRQSLDGGNERQLLLDLQVDQIYGFAWSFDRKFLALSRGRQMNDAILLKNFD